MASTRVVAALLLAMLATARACNYQCPSGLAVSAVGVDAGTTCNYQCCAPCKPQCYQPAFPNSPLWKPYCCGGTTGVTCPTIACTKSYSQAISGPGGCAKATASIQALAISKSVYASVYNTAFGQGEICSEYDPAVIAYGLAVAYAEACAASLANYCIYACTCCLGNTQAVAAVTADIQAVAQASAEAAADALVLATCGGQLIAGAATSVDALAQDTQLAILSVFDEVAAWNGGCIAVNVQGLIQTAVAKASACYFFNLVLSYYNGGPQAYSCGETAAIAGPQFSCDCVASLPGC